MGTFAEAKFTVRAVNKTEKAFSQINKNINNMDRRFSKLGGNLKRIGGLMATAFVGRQIVDTITKFEKLEASLKTITGSAENAKTAFSFIQEFASTTPFQLEEVTEAFIKLKALGLTPSAEALTSYGNTATAMGKSLNQMIEAVADAATGEFERLKEFGIKSKSQGDQVTFTFQGISTTVGKNAAEIEGYLQDIGDVQFAGAMAEQAGTLNVALSNMGDSFSKLIKAIGDAGLTDILLVIADSIKWLAEKITASIEPFKLGFQAIIGEMIKFGNFVVEIFTGIGDAFNAFFENIANRFEAFGKDLANFVADPLGGVSFDNTAKALETGLLESMDDAFNAALERAEEFNRNIDKEIGDAADKVFESGQQKPGALDEIFGKKKQEEVKKGAEKIEKTAGKSADKIEDKFEKLGKSIEEKILGSLDKIGGGFDGLKDLAKDILTEIGEALLKTSLDTIKAGGSIQDVLGGIAGSIEGIFGSIGGGSSSGGGSGIGAILGGTGDSGGGFGDFFSDIGSFFGGFFADGGTLRPGQFGVVGERGAELAFAGNSPLNIMPNNGMMGAPITVNMNIQTPDVQSFRQSQSQIAADMARQIDRAKRNL